MLNLFELEPENIYGVAVNTAGKEEKIRQHLDSGEYIASLKKDGNYARFVNFNDEVKMQTRGKSVVTGTYGEVQDKVPHITKWLDNKVPKNSLLIGELYRPEWNDKDVGSILRCLPPKAVARQKTTPLYFYIHDVWAWDGEELLFSTKKERVQFLKNLEAKWIAEDQELPYFIEFAEYYEGVEAIDELLAYAFENNEEGIVCTLKGSVATPGKKTAWKTIKIKKELQNEADVFLTGGFKEATREYTGKDIANWEFWENEKNGQKLFGKLYKDYLDGATIRPITKPYYKGWPGSLEMAVIGKDKQIMVIGYISGIADEIKADFAINPDKYKNQVCVVNAMETTADYKLRHPKFIKFRDDINIEDCTFEKIFEVNEKGE